MVQNRKQRRILDWKKSGHAENEKENEKEADFDFGIRMGNGIGTCDRLQPAEGSSKSLE